MIEVTFHNVDFAVAEGDTHRVLRLTPLVQGYPLGVNINIPIERLASAQLGKALLGEVVNGEPPVRMDIPKEKKN